MQSFKRENFEKANPGTTLTGITEVTPERCEFIRSNLISRLRLHRSAGGRDIVEAIASRGRTVHGVNATNASFRLDQVFWQLNVHSAPQVYVNWHQFDEVDEMPLRLLCDHFTDIWYPSSDDIDIFDDSLAWVVSVYHDGEVRMLRM